jgi:transposase
MFVVKKPTRNPEYFRVLIVENLREKGKVKQKILRNIGTARDQVELEQYLKLAHASLEYEIEKKHKCELLFKYADNLEDIPNGFKIRAENFIEKKRVHEGIECVYGSLFDSLGFNQVLENENYQAILKDLVVARILNPQSKLKTQEIIEKDCNKSIPLHSIYRTLDALEKREEELLSITFSATRSLFEDKIDLVFFDVTTLYFESTEQDEIKAFGFSKDHKFNQVQVVFALATTQEGLPVGYKLFRGNTAETKTLLACLEEWKKFISIENVIFVADRAMFSYANIAELEKAGHKYIIAAKLRSLSEERKEKILSRVNYHIQDFNDDILWSKEIEHSFEIKEKDSESGTTTKTELKGRLICSYSSKRARKDMADRQRMIEKINKHISNSNLKTDTKKLVTNACLKKFCKFSGKSAAELDPEKVQNDEKWDGMHGIFTNSEKPINEVLSRYKCLWQIEETFRITKNDLRVRPIYHYKPSRIRAHIMLCYLSLCLIRQLQVRLKRANVKISMQRVHEELRRVQYSVCKDLETKVLFKVPSALNPVAQQIYKALGLKRKQNLSVIQE